MLRLVANPRDNPRLFWICMEHARMKYPLIVRRALLPAASCALLQHGGFVLAAQGDEAAPRVGTRPAMNALTPQPVAAALREFCRARGLAQWKVPREVQVVPDLPRSPTGKVLKRMLAG